MITLLPLHGFSNGVNRKITVMESIEYVQLYNVARPVGKVMFGIFNCELEYTA